MSQKINHDGTTTTRSFLTNDPVLVKNFNNTGQKWLRGHIIKPVGPLSYMIKLSDGRIFRRHVDHLRKSFIPPNQNSETVNDSDYFDVVFPNQESTSPSAQNVTQRRYPVRERTLTYEHIFCIHMLCTSILGERKCSVTTIVVVCYDRIFEHMLLYACTVIPIVALLCVVFHY